MGTAERIIGPFSLRYRALAWRFLLPKQVYRDTAQAYLVLEANKQGLRADFGEGY